MIRSGHLIDTPIGNDQTFYFRINAPILINISLAETVFTLTNSYNLSNSFICYSNKIQIERLLLNSKWVNSQTNNKNKKSEAMIINGKNQNDATHERHLINSTIVFFFCPTFELPISKMNLIKLEKIKINFGPILIVWAPCSQKTYASLE